MTELTIILTHDVEKTFNEERTASMLTLDVKGAFDAVLPEGVLYRIRVQDWPNNLVDWVGSYATGRSVRIRIDIDICLLQKVTCDLTQKPPVSPVLFVLYIQPLFRLDNLTYTFGYVDDVAILATQKLLPKNGEFVTKFLR